METKLYEEFLNVAEAREKLIEHLKPTQTEVLPLFECVGRVLAQDVVAEVDLPPFSSSAMDGYAVRAEDVGEVDSQKPVQLDVVGDVAAGSTPRISLGPRQAVRIMTGAVLPHGADAVVPVEFTSSPGAMAGKAAPDHVEVQRRVNPGDYIRRAGQDVRQGSLVLDSGNRLRPQEVGMLAALGISQPLVYRRPSVAILSTGDELLEPDADLPPGKIRDSNGYSLAAAIISAGGIPMRLGITPDDPEAIAHSLDLAVEQGADLILSSAGVSMGATDYVRDIVQTNGSLAFWRVNVRPGKPLLFGEYGGIPFLGLPGNPVSALVSFEVFVRAAIDHMRGLKGKERASIIVHVEEPVESDGRESYLRAIVHWEAGGYLARLTGSQDSGILSSLVKANALLIIPAGVVRLEPGDAAKAWLLD